MMIEMINDDSDDDNQAPSSVKSRLKGSLCSSAQQLLGVKE